MDIVHPATIVIVAGAMTMIQNAMKLATTPLMAGMPTTFLAKMSTSATMGPRLHLMLVLSEGDHRSKN